MKEEDNSEMEIIDNNKDKAKEKLKLNLSSNSVKPSFDKNEVDENK